MLDRLAFWGFNINAEIDTINFGDIAVRSSQDYRFRVKNLSTSYHARGVVVDVSIVSNVWFDYRPFMFSLDGYTFTGSLSVGDVGPGALTPGFFMRRITQSNEPQVQHTCTLSATAASWTHVI